MALPNQAKLSRKKKQKIRDSATSAANKADSNDPASTESPLDIIPLRNKVSLELMKL
eukprot:CAMPEP_0170507258 /NCGR_PEP_ID=MMETSP0208-20121228/58240_1 /TAXON_ID=197538 /ORGANISM="Strombidium inclinatum, Strain S3" /LENGTH=56 /DNA_ID=CAMNT_0010789319 /DNA_START=176 /DNA_END=346 /DNA_ORIENTATION=+